MNRIMGLLFFAVVILLQCSPAGPQGKALELCRQLKLDYPARGFVSGQPSARWEESLITGNGTIGALIRGIPGNDTIILSHERLFMPEYPPTKAPNLKIHLKKIRRLVLAGKGAEAAKLAVQAGREAGIGDVVWTDPLVPACQLEAQAVDGGKVLAYTRTVNYETGEATTAWKTNDGIVHQRMFISRPAGLAVYRLNSVQGSPLNFRFRLNQLPLPRWDDEDEAEFDVNELISTVKMQAKDGRLSYFTRFKKQWPGALKGYLVSAKVYPGAGQMESEEGWLRVSASDEILILANIQLFYEDEPPRPSQMPEEPDYDQLLNDHAAVQSEMFNRFDFDLGAAHQQARTSEELLATSSPGHLSNELLVQLMRAARYELISSTGELPPTLQGIWGGTWRPAWSGDFTLNGNVPSAIASGLNDNFPEVTRAYLNYMYSMFDDFRDNARDLYGADGIFVPSRASSSGKTYHYLVDYPHLYWFAGAAWTSQFFYDYWLYWHDETFLREKTIPFMLESYEFYKDILTTDESGKYMFIPSYSPEVGPVGMHPVAINATMDVAALKQLLRNLITLAGQGLLEKDRVDEWQDMLARLPAYQVDEKGDLKEWLWPGYKNNNRHRHASHLYPLFFETDPEFEQRPELKQAAMQAIENRLAYRRAKNGAEMAFGLVQLGLAAAHLQDTKHAYECVDWLGNSYWSPAFTSYHDPGEIFNADISGGFPAVVTEMIVQSSEDQLLLLPALPPQWPEGTIKGVVTRCGVIIDLDWKNGLPQKAKLKARRDTGFKLKFKDREWQQDLKKGQTTTLDFESN